MIGDLTRGITAPDAPVSAPLTRESLEAVFEQMRDQDYAREREAAEAYRAFIDATPEQFRTHPTIVQLATIAAHSQINPIHPRHLEAIKRAYDEVVNAK